MADRAVVDLLALERTILANERTLLAYLRTALGFAAAGAVALRQTPLGPVEWTLGIGGAVFAVVLTILGLWRFSAARRRYAGLVGKP